jgi:hypothetical protein
MRERFSRWTLHNESMYVNQSWLCQRPCSWVACIVLFWKREGIYWAVFELNTSRNTRVGFLNKTPWMQHASRVIGPRKYSLIYEGSTRTRLQKAVNARGLGNYFCNYIKMSIFSTGFTDEKTSNTQITLLICLRGRGIYPKHQYKSSFNTDLIR